MESKIQSPEDLVGKEVWWVDAAGDINRGVIRIMIKKLVRDNGNTREEIQFYGSVYTDPLKGSGEFIHDNHTLWSPYAKDSDCRSFFSKYDAIRTWVELHGTAIDTNLRRDKEHQKKFYDDRAVKTYNLLCRLYQDFLDITRLGRDNEDFLAELELLRKVAHNTFEYDYNIELGEKVKARLDEYETYLAGGKDAVE